MPGPEMKSTGEVMGLVRSEPGVRSLQSYLGLDR